MTVYRPVIKRLITPDMPPGTAPAVTALLQASADLGVVAGEAVDELCELGPHAQDLAERIVGCLNEVTAAMNGLGAAMQGH